MSLVPDIQNPAIDNLIAASNKKGIPNSEITEIKSTQIYNVYSAIRKQTYDDDGATDEAMIVLVLLGNNEECTTKLARIYSLPTPEYNCYGKPSCWRNRGKSHGKIFLRSQTKSVVDLILA